MKASKGKTKKKQKGKQPPVSGAALESAMTRIEFHRDAIALMPEPGDRCPGIAAISGARKRKVGQRFCSCGTGQSRTCNHKKELEKLQKVIRDRLNGRNPMDVFRVSFWFRLAKTMNQGGVLSLDRLRIQSAEENRIKIFDNRENLLVTYQSDGPDRYRLLERCLPPSDDTSVPTRYSVIKQLAAMSISDDEHYLNESGFRSRRQAFESSFWYRFFYHCFREWGDGGFQFFPAISEPSGKFMLRCKKHGEQEVFALEIPRTRVKSVLTDLKDVLSTDNGVSFDPIPLNSIFDVRLNSDLDLEILPMVRLIQEDGVVKFFRREDLQRYRYGDLVYIKELGILAKDQQSKKPPKKFKESVKTVVQRSQVPHFLDKYEAELKSDAFRVDQNVRRLKILRDIPALKITQHFLERKWCWLSGTYGEGNQAVALQEVIKAKQTGQPYIATAGGWIDCRAAAFDPVETMLALAEEQTLTDGKDRVRLSRLALLKLLAGSTLPEEPESRNDAASTVLKNLVTMKPVRPLPSDNGLTAPLRDYQQKGAEWLWFLIENGFGGLLCDDMGLGKTHQVMALLSGMQKHADDRQLFLVICPTTVISHWEKKLAEHAPGLKYQVYYGNQRNLREATSRADVVLTSYGILHRDIEQLCSHFFTVAVFDEIQHLKNPATKSYTAARALKAAGKIGLTGTPIESSLNELKALLDLTLPGYLGKDALFCERYIVPIEQEGDRKRREELRRLIYPFTLRRSKNAVLDELPPKIEDLRICRLSEDQVKLYRDAVENRAASLVNALSRGKDPVPYIHIFALLNLLKQICNHPALVKNGVKDYKRFQSGKWDLFTELIDEVLDSGQKVVVYSQYLGMIDIIYDHLQAQGVGTVCLTGKSRNRGRIIDRFQQDDDCRVFVGSLKAGGTGIDLISASIVIHYDRWWNAAKEDQATDRVHRIGQTRGVQVIKIITEGTLEEKIAAIIERKRNLMEKVVKEDDPNLIKSFSRDDLIDLLAIPSQY